MVHIFFLFQELPLDNLLSYNFQNKKIFFLSYFSYSMEMNFTILTSSWILWIHQFQSRKLWMTENTHRNKPTNTFEITTLRPRVIFYMLTYTACKNCIDKSFTDYSKCIIPSYSLISIQVFACYYPWHSGDRLGMSVRIYYLSETQIWYFK